MLDEACGAAIEEERKERGTSAKCSANVNSEQRSYAQLFRLTKVCFLFIYPIKRNQARPLATCHWVHRLLTLSGGNPTVARLRCRVNLAVPVSVNSISQTARWLAALQLCLPAWLASLPSRGACWAHGWARTKRLNGQLVRPTWRTCSIRRRHSSAFPPRPCPEQPPTPSSIDWLTARHVNWLKINAFRAFIDTLRHWLLRGSARLYLKENDTISLGFKCQFHK